MIPRNNRRATTIGCDGGISKMCFKKKVFNSEICQNMTIWQTAKNLMYVLLGSSQRTCVQLTGVNWRTALFSLPVVDRISLQIQNRVELMKIIKTASELIFVQGCNLETVLKYLGFSFLHGYNEVSIKF